MQNHRIFVEALHAMRDELRNNLLASDRALVPPIKTSVGATGMEFARNFCRPLVTELDLPLRRLVPVSDENRPCEEILYVVGVVPKSVLFYN